MTFPLRFHDYDLIYNSSASCSTIEAHDHLNTELLMYACFSLSLIIMYIFTSICSSSELSISSTNPGGESG